MVRAFRAALGLATLLAVQTAAAQEAGTTRPTSELEAKRDFEGGVRWLRAGRWVAAEACFRRSLALTPRPSASYDLAFALYKQGRARESAELLQRLLAASENTPDSPYRGSAKELLTNVLAQLAAVPVIVDTPAAEVRIDTSLASQPAPKMALEPTPRPPLFSAVAPWVTMGVGGALLSAAAVTGMLAKREDDTFRGACPSLRNCDPRLVSTRDRAVQLGLVTDALLASGGALVVGGVTWRLLVSGESRADRRAAWVVADGFF